MMKSFIVFAATLAVALAAYKPAANYNRPAAYSRPVQSYSAGQEIPILRQASDINPDGSYSYSYETGNGISASEQGFGGQQAQGQAAWTAPDGEVVQFSYVADENGYQPTGSHIPTPPPVPEPILRALEYIRTHPQKEDQYNQYKAAPLYQAKPTYNQQKPYNRRF